ncbi:uncharacterized protein B0J16DRAFT_364547 [Fusarium flagelliforme]|uniref:uncharacterized protein n=1 Tax=Fusarium flagelliforme TaxID=2675880 RepID=UPI001E8DCCE1|nr:uncharacterized protein B0J16DRAFT_364547 [Fusarium flagelliforme]KAH7174171.1 hypothetical protein B0J16DRAFT_364547 [Fusarium flagelliforme]
MRSNPLLLSITLLTSVQCIKLRRTEFNVLISARQSLILFTADGCKECDRVQRVLDDVSPVLSETAIASVNCNEEPVVCDDAQIFTVPTVKYTMGNSELVTYKEGLDASSIVKYIERQSGPPVVDIGNQSHIDFARSSRVAVVAFLGPSGIEEARKEFNTIAERWRGHYSFGSVDRLDKNSAQHSIAVYMREEEDPTYYSGPFKVDDIEAFLQGATQPLIREFYPSSYEQAIADKKPLAQIFFSKHDERSELVKSLIPLAKEYKDQLTFMTILVSDFPNRVEKMHLSKDLRYGFAIADHYGRAYPMSTTTLSANRIKKHVSAFLAGSLKPTIKSEPVPQAPTLPPFVTKLVGSNFDDFVYDKSRDVLVEFHVPWCQYCTDLHKVMNELGSQYAKSGLADKIALATINVDRNDVPLEIDSYPSLRLYRAGDNGIASFQGDLTQMLTVEQLDTFISKNGGSGVSAISQGTANNHDEL